MRKCLLLWMLFNELLVQNSYAQNLFFQSYSTADGLSQNSIYSIAQTKDGFMWFGTQDGLNRFDGKKFTRLAITDPVRLGRFSKMITALLADSDDWLWVGTTQEVMLYNRYTKQFVVPGDILKNFLLPASTYINKIVEDGNKNIWILSQNDGLFCYSKSQKKMISVGREENMKTLTFLCRDSQGKIWAGNGNKIYQFRANKFEAIWGGDKSEPRSAGIVDLCSINNELWLITKAAGIVILRPHKTDYISFDFSKEFKGKSYLTDARLMHQSDANTIWIGSRSEGLIKINLVEKTFENAGALGNNYSLKSHFVLSFFTDKQDITWIGLSGGIAKYDTRKIQFNLWRNDPLPGRQIPDNRLLSVFSQNDEDFYMGTLYSGLMHTNVKSNTYRYYMPPNIGSGPGESKNIYEVIAGENGLLWMATKAGLYSFHKATESFTQYKDANDKHTVELCGLIKLKLQNKLLTGGYNGGLRLFDLDKKIWEKCMDPKNVMGIPVFRVRFMKEMEEGNVYLSTEGKNLVKYNYITGAFTFFPDLQKVSGTSRYFSYNGQDLWVATDDGLLQVSRSGMNIKNVWTAAQGLSNDYIYAVLPDSFGRVWLSSNGGLTMLDPQSGLCKNFTENDGLQDREFNTASCYKDSKGKLWFGGINGLNMVDPELSGSNTYAPTPLITAINVMNAPFISDTATPYVHSLTLPFNQNFLSFEFQSPDFSQSENITYAYKLTGVDTGWVNSGTRNFVSYTQLKPGQYHFMVRSANANHIPSKNSIDLHIIIVPPWYKTWWFYLLSSSILLYVFYLFIKQRINSIRYKAATQQKITETEMAALKAQMNPHFMFNCINSIDAFIQTNDKYNATLYLNKFAKLIRNVLDSSKQNIVPFTKDIETLKLYIELEELRSENKFTTQIKIDEELLENDYHVPPLVIQPYVENAIIHGLRNREGDGGLLAISISNTESHIVYVITDNGIGRKAAEKINTGKEKSYGMQMSYDRIKLFNKELIPSVTVSNLDENESAIGTRVIVQLKKW